MYKTRYEKNHDHKIDNFIGLREEIRIIMVYLKERVSEQYFRKYVLSEVQLKHPYPNDLFKKCFDIDFKTEVTIKKLFLMFDPINDEVLIQTQNTAKMEFMLKDFKNEHVWRRVFKMWQRLEVLDIREKKGPDLVIKKDF